MATDTSSLGIARKRALPALLTEAGGHYSNRRRAVEKLNVAWNSGVVSVVNDECEPENLQNGIGVRGDAG
jgi:hypothetical protein